jgi:hypothetical protein
MDSTWHSQSDSDYYIQPPDEDFSSDMLNLFPFDESVFQASADPQSTSRTTMGTSLPTPLDLSPGTASSPFLNPGPHASEDIWLFNPATGEVGANPGAASTPAPSKRSRGPTADGISACWTSPLCPNKKADGGRPDSCKGECADFLFAHPSELPEDKKILAELLAKSQPRVVLELPTDRQQRRGVKRQDMESASATGRALTKPSSPPIKASSSRAASRATPESSTGSSTAARTSPTDVDDDDREDVDDDDGGGGGSPAAAPKPKGRVPHNQVEKKYRLNVNAQLDALRRVVPVSRQRLAGFDGGVLDVEDLAAAGLGPASALKQPSKAAVLASATAYILQLENENARLLDEVRELKGQNGTLQSLVKCEDCSLMNYVKKWKIQGSM